MNHRPEKTSLGNSEAVLSLALRVTKAGTWQWDRVTNQVFWSKENFQLLGYDPQTTTASYENWLKAVHPGDRERVNSLITQAFAAATELHLEYRVLLTDGRVRWLETFGEAIDTENGEPGGMIGIQFDITERKQTEQLQQTRLQVAMEAARIGIWESDLRTNTEWWSPQVEALFGFAPNTFDGDRNTFLERVHPDDRAIVNADWEAAMQTGTLRDNDYRIVLPDQSIRWLSTLGKVLYDEAGDPIRVIGVDVDITQRKQAEEELRQSELRFRNMAANVPGAIFRYVMHPDGSDRVVYMSPGCFDLWEVQAEEVVKNARILWDQIDEEDRPAMYESVLASARTLQPWSWQWRITTPSGKRKWLEASGRPQRLPNGDTVWDTLILDVSDRKRAELEIRQLNEALEQQNRNLEALVEQRTALLLTFINALPDYIFVIEREEMRILFCNDRLASTTLLGDRSAVQGKTIFECFPAANAAYFAEQNRQVFESGETLHIQEDFELNSHHLYIDTYKIPLKRPDGEVYALIGTSRDITELVLARQALVQRTAQLEASNKELESFSYSVSHDLRAPLRHIHGFVHALQQRLQGHYALSDPKVLHYLQVIENSSKKMGALIDGLLTLSRVGRKPMHYAPVQLRTLVEEAIALVQSSTETKVAAEFVIGELPTVRGDATLLQQVFSNLISNAVKFSQNHPTPRIEIGSSPEGTIWIKDNGVGFQMEYADKLFGAFQRLHNQSEFEGTGIGLAIVQRIIHRHGGTIWAESQPHQGATFFFNLAREKNLTPEKDYILF